MCQVDTRSAMVKNASATMIPPTTVWVSIMMWRRSNRSATTPATSKNETLGAP